MATSRQFYSFRDSKNQVATVGFYVSGAAIGDQNSAASAIQLALIPLTNAHLDGGTGPSPVPPAAPVAGANAVYANVEDKARFVFDTATGQVHKLSIPAPKASIFQADAETIDYANADVAAFVAAYTAGAVTRDGVRITESIGGGRIRSRTRRRFNVRTRNPALTGQGL
jgi:hypothetical protein